MQHTSELHAKKTKRTLVSLQDAEQAFYSNYCSTRHEETKIQHEKEKQTNAQHVVFPKSHSRAHPKTNASLLHNVEFEEPCF
eukprot:290872-Amphidinium_carterae.1